jgi:ubiquinone/menaquinone biosynthesis C-methylase UbiE
MHEPKIPDKPKNTEECKTMKSESQSDPTYVLGRSSDETQRLIQQSDLLQRPTRHLFEDAGISPGMRVLDIGSGAGDVALLAAEMVGPTGEVIGVDVNSKILEVARKRARERGFSNVSFEDGDFRQRQFDRDFDGVVGRFVLLYQKDPVDALRSVLRNLKQGGVIALMDADFTVPFESRPACELHQNFYRWVYQAFERGGMELNMGMRLPEAFAAVGLPAPEMQAAALIGSGDEFVRKFSDYASGTLRSLLPRILEYGIATEEELDLESFASRYSEQLRGRSSVIRWGLTVSAWSRKP